LPPTGRSYIWKLFFCHGRNLAILGLLCPFFRLLANLILISGFLYGGSGSGVTDCAVFVLLFLSTLFG